ncbi:MAG: protein kinase [Myxococcota bacterium]|nr:protein kinase [Myxococcota bacterium]MDW8363997.1 serine/threonine-protein kinase [Myxococcales bacterium]
MPIQCQRCAYSNADGSRFCLHCGSPLPQVESEPPDPLVGRVISGRYRIVRVIGEGGMGKVYLAEQKMGATARKVAIKTLQTALVRDPQLVARFHRECETVIQLSHPNTITLIDFGEMEDGTLYIVMEYVEGHSLARELERGPLPLERIDRILIQICGSLHEAHGRGIVHRDLKPENILLTTRGGQSDFVKVLDFGIAKRQDAEDDNRPKLTMQGTVLGTPPYMSPEQFGTAQLDARSDIYSLGLIVYEMVCGRLPFEASTPWEWATRHLSTPPTPIEAHPHGAALSPQRRAAVMRALSKDREQRQRTVLEFMFEFTGQRDPQLAWTGAAPAVGQTSIPPTATFEPQPQIAARAPVGTPAPIGVGTFGPQPAHGGHLSLSGVEASTAPRRSNTGIVIALAVVGVFLVGGAAAGGLFWWGLSGDDAPQVTATDPPPRPPPLPPFPRTHEPTPTTGTTGTPIVPPPAPNVPVTPPGPGPVVEGPPIAPPTAPGTDPQFSNGDDRGGQQDEGPQSGSQGGGPSAADVARAQSLAQAGMAALGRDDLRAAATSLAQAQRLVGRSHPVVRALRAELARKGRNAVGIQLQRGQCAQAQELYRLLREAGVERGIGEYFGDWCRRP